MNSAATILTTGVFGVFFINKVIKLRRSSQAGSPVAGILVCNWVSLIRFHYEMSV